MRLVAVVCNVALLAFTCLVLLTEGVSREAPYLVLTLLLLLVPMLSSVVLVRTGMKRQGQGADADRSSVGAPANRLAAFCNLLLLGWSCWAIVAQYPHPEEDGVIAFTLLVVLTPMITLAALFGSRKRKTQERERTVARQ